MSFVISSLQNKFVKSAAGLKQKKHRDELGQFMAEGVRLCEELAASEWQIDTCFFTGSAAQDDRTLRVLDTLRNKGCSLFEVSASVLDKIAETEEPQGIIVIARQRKMSIKELLSLVKVPLIAVLDDVRDPGNAGTIIRTADAAGCNGVIFLKGCADLYAGKTIRATMGSLFHLPVIEGVARSELVAAKQDYGIKLAVTSLTAAQRYYEADLTGALALVFGSESQGISAEVTEASQSRIFIPMLGKAESLNVAAAAAVILYEAARQRGL